MKINLKYLS